MIKPKLRFPEFRRDWEKRGLDELLVESQERNYDLKYSKDDVLSVSGEHGIVNQIEHKGRSFAGASVANYHIVKVGDIVYTKSPLKLTPYGIIKVNTGKDGIVSTLYAVYKCLEPVHGLFLDYYFQHNDNTNKYLRPLVHKGAKNDMKINNSAVLKGKIYVPKKDEQEKIMKFLTSVDTRIISLSQKLQLLEKYKKGILQKIFNEELKFKNKDGKSFPKWTTAKAKDMFASHSKRNHNGDLPILAATQENGMVPRDTIGIEIQSSEASIKSYKLVEPGDFVISLRSFQGGIEYSEFKGICSPAYTILKPKVEIDNQFFRFYFKKDDFITRLSQTVVGIRDGKQISYEAFGGMKLKIPCIEEQRQISKFLNCIDFKIGLAAKQLELTRQFKRGLLQQMFI